MCQSWRDKKRRKDCNPFDKHCKRLLDATSVISQILHDILITGVCHSLETLTEIKRVLNGTERKTKGQKQTHQEKDQRKGDVDLQSMQVFAISKDFGDNIRAMSQEVTFVSIKVYHCNMIKGSRSPIRNRQLHEVVVLTKDGCFVDGQPSFRTW